MLPNDKVNFRIIRDLYRRSERLALLRGLRHVLLVLEDTAGLDAHRQDKTHTTVWLVVKCD